MAITRAYLEATLAGPAPGGLRGWLQEAGIPLDLAGPNPFFDPALAEALDALGLPPADPASVTDADLAAIPPLLRRQVLDRAAVGALRWLLGQLPEIDVRGNDYQEWQSQFPDRVAAELARREAKLLAEYGPPLTAVRPAAAAGDAPWPPCGAGPPRNPPPGRGPDGLFRLPRRPDACDW
jgi:hypothetical protein